MARCEKCGDFILHAKCNCKEHSIIDADIGDEIKYFAVDEREAAEKHAEYINQEGDLMNDCRDILVNGKAYRIWADPDVHYSARCIDDE